MTLPANRPEVGIAAGGHLLAVKSLRRIASICNNLATVGAAIAPTVESWSTDPPIAPLTHRRRYRWVNGLGIDDRSAHFAPLVSNLA
jgi:hypothetical protein